jgi:hypothetical protein
MEKDFYPVDYVAKRLKADAPVLRLAYSREGRRAEIERKPLTRLDPTYRRDIGKLLRAMAEEGGQARKARYGEGIWKNFISNAIWRKK